MKRILGLVLVFVFVLTGVTALHTMLGAQVAPKGCTTDTECGCTDDCLEGEEVK